MFLRPSKYKYHCDLKRQNLKYKKYFEFIQKTIIFENNRSKFPITKDNLKLSFTEQIIQRYTVVCIKIIEAIGRMQRIRANLEFVSMLSFCDIFIIKCIDKK